MNNKDYTEKMLSDLIDLNISKDKASELLNLEERIERDEKLKLLAQRYLGLSTLLQKGILSAEKLRLKGESAYSYIQCYLENNSKTYK